MCSESDSKPAATRWEASRRTGLGVPQREPTRRAIRRFARGALPPGDLAQLDTSRLIRMPKFRNYATSCACWWFPSRQICEESIQKLAHQTPELRGFDVQTQEMMVYVTYARIAKCFVPITLAEHFMAHPTLAHHALRQQGEIFEACFPGGEGQTTGLNTSAHWESDVGKIYLSGDMEVYLAMVLFLYEFMAWVPDAPRHPRLYRVEDSAPGWALQFQEAGMCKLRAGRREGEEEEMEHPFDLAACMETLLVVNRTLTLAIMVTYSRYQRIWEWSNRELGVVRGEGLHYLVVPAEGEEFVRYGKPVKLGGPEHWRLAESEEVLMLPGSQFKVECIVQETPKRTLVTLRQLRTSEQTLCA